MSQENKFYAIAFFENKSLIEAKTKEEAIQLAKKCLSSNPEIQSFEIVKIVSKVSKTISVIDFQETDKPTPAFCEMPPNLPELPKDFAYFGFRPIYQGNALASKDIAMVIGNSWMDKCSGNGKDCHYAVKRNTKAFADAALVHVTGQRIYVP